ncbi:LamG domain-containing protein [Candidatus Pacearchaeota archaeon]|nr:LamG domain-containing protein [Candidatus Pacearchaeota archaeon]
MKKLILSFVLAITFMLVMSVSVMAATPEDLMGWWKFEQGSGATAYDSSGNNNDGTIYGATYTTGKVGNYALNFNGNDDYVNVGSSDNFDFTGKFTVEAWVNGNSFQTNYYDLIVFRGYNNWAFGIFRGDRLMFGETAWNSLWSRQIYSDTLSWETNQWYHIAVVYDTVARTADFYRDGVSVGAGKQSTDKCGITNSGDVTINYPHSVSFNGIIDEVRIWDVADMDGDGVPDSVDRCPGTVADEPEKRLGTNRWMWDGSAWITKSPKGDGPQKSFSMEDTRGCSCEQILETMGDGKKTGHSKFGCSASVIEDFIAGLPPLLVDTVEVYANDPSPTYSPTYSNIALEFGVEYELEAMGTANAGGNIYFDAEYSTRDGWATQQDGVLGYESLGENLLDLKVDNNFVDWGAYNTEHTYYQTVTGAGIPLELWIYDSYPYNNIGVITVNIYELP